MVEKMREDFDSKITARYAHTVALPRESERKVALLKSKGIKFISIVEKGIEVYCKELGIK